MIFGRNTAQWTGLLTALSGALAVALPLLIPNGIGTVPLSSLIALVGIATTFLGVFIAFLANSELTPVSDPRLPIGTLVNRTSDKETNGVVVVDTPPPGPAGDAA